MYRYAIAPGSLTEQQSSDDLMRLQQTESDLLADPRVNVDVLLVRSTTCHKSVSDQHYSYRAFTDAIKAPISGVRPTCWPIAENMPS